MSPPKKFVAGLIFVLLLPGAGLAPSAQPSTNYWALKLPVRPALPKIKNKTWPHTPLDQFILAKLEEKGISTGPMADRATLLRRATFDLHGLPPTPAELDAFLADKSPDAFARVLDRLLASPHYGERWGRHWLDVARFAESQGFEYDKIREHAWRYRDYVIQSFNEDKSYFRFIKEQIAGDALEPISRDGIVATGFLVAGPYDEAGNTSASVLLKARIREEELEDMIAAVSQTFLGLTVNCARCHDHKFDPIPQRDYYRIKAAFDGVRHGERSLLTPMEIKTRELQEAQSKARIAGLETQLTALEQSARSRIAAHVSEAESPGWQAASPVNKEPLPMAKWTFETDATDIRFNNLGVISSDEMLKALTTEERQQRGAVLAELERLRQSLKTGPEKPFAYAANSRQPEATFVLSRGDVEKKKEPVTAGGLSAVSTLAENFGLGADAPEKERRAKLADWIASPANPLTARVMVNRVWHYHFGRGIVATPNDFGVNGERPSHPELLDYLATEFITQGGSIKKLHRLIMLSSTYQQSGEAGSRPSLNSPAGKDEQTRPGEVSPPQIDGENRLLWHFPLRRLEAEAVRDAMLSVSGQLKLQMGGASYRPFTVFVSNSHFYNLTDPIGPEYDRRTLYRMTVHSGRDPLLDSFDCPDPSTKTPVRGITTTPIQALGLMNDSFIQRQASGFAERLKREAGANTTAQVDEAWRLALGRQPRNEETARASALAREHGMESVCWVLLNASEFLYVR